MPKGIFNIMKTPRQSIVEYSFLYNKIRSGIRSQYMFAHRESYIGNNNIKKQSCVLKIRQGCTVRYIQLTTVYQFMQGRLSEDV